MSGFEFSAAYQSYSTRAKPSLPEDMRRLIDAAVAEGRVTKVPTGVSGLPGCFWDGDAQNGSGMLRPVEARGWREQARGAAGRKAVQKASVRSRQQRTDELTAQIARLHRQGLPVAEIAEAVGLTCRSVNRHLARLPADQGRAA